MLDLQAQGARQLFPRHHFIPSEFPEEPIGYSAEQGFGFYQGGPGSVVGPGDRYEIRAKLGCGITSTVWLAKDREASAEDRRYVAIKILAGYATSLNKRSFLRELDVAKLLAGPKASAGEDHIARVSGAFFQPGVEKGDGEHLCLVMDFYPNDLLSAQYARHPKPFPVRVVKRVLKHLAKGLAALHDHGIAHTDVKPSSILIKASDDNWRQGNAIRSWYEEEYPPRKCRPVRTPKGMKSSWISPPSPPLPESFEDCDFVLSDFSHAEFIGDAKMPQHAVLPLRAPELIIGLQNWDQKVDIWSFGLLAFNLLTNSTFIYPSRLPGFPPRADIVESMLYQMACATGERFPDWLLNEAMYSGKYFRTADPKERGKLVNFEDYEDTGPISNILLQEATRLGAALRRDDLEGASDLLTRCLTIDPKKRASAREIVRHPWIR